MGHSQVKKSIDKIIGEKRWMTPDLANKMAQPKKKKKQLIFFMPIFATLAIATIAFFLITSNETQPQLNQSNLNESKLNEAKIVRYLRHMADAKFSESILSYLITIEQQNKHAIIEMGQGAYNEQNVETLLSKYSSIDFSTITHIKTVSIDDSPVETYHVYFTHENIDSANTFMHKLQVERTDKGWNVFESPDATWVTYEPFKVPDYLAFHYEPVAAIEPDHSYRFKDMMLAYPSIQITKDMTAHFYVEGGKVAFVIVNQKEEIYFPVTMLEKLDSGSEPHPYVINVIQNEHNYDYYTLSSTEASFLTFYYNESTQKVQVLFAEPGATISFDDIDNNGIHEIFINNKKSPTVATVEVGQLVAATPNANFATHWNDAFVTVEYNYKVVTVTYKDVHGEKYANYTWQTVNEAHYLNNLKLNKIQY